MPSITLPTPFDAGEADTWGGILNTAVTTSNTEHTTRTGAQDFADQVLKRPKLADYGEPVNAIGSVSGTLSHDISATECNHFSATLTGDVSTFSISNPAASGNLCVVVAYITQDGTGGREITFGSAYRSVGVDEVYTLANTTAGSITRLTFETIDAGTTWYVTEEVLKP